MEKIYTIPVNDAFDEKCGCPFCTLYRKLEKDELEIILGASMMEPDVRIKTNEKGFCKKHYDKMFTMNNRLGLALMLESHLDKRKGDFFGKTLFGETGAKASKEIEKHNGSCYVCSRIEHNYEKMFECACLLYLSDSAFKKKVEETPFFCIPHFKRFADTARLMMKKKDFADFFALIEGVTRNYYTEIEKDISWFIKKYDYRYEAEPWGNSKDAVERAIKFLKGDF